MFIENGNKYNSGGVPMFCQKCGAEIPDSNNFCGKCGAPVSSVVKTPNKGENIFNKRIGCLGIIGIILVFAFFHGLTNRSNNVSAPKPLMEIGDIALTDSKDKSEVIIGTTASSLKSIEKSQAAGDHQGTIETITSGGGYFVDGNIQVRIIDREMYIRKIRVLEGPMTGKTGWIQKDLLKPAQ